MATTVTHPAHRGKVRLQALVSIEAARLIKEDAVQSGEPYFSPGNVISRLAEMHLPRTHVPTNKRRTSRLDEELAS